MTSEVDQPVCTEVNVSASVGGKVQIVKYEYTADFHYSMSRKYSIPADWDESEVAQFQAEKTVLLRQELETPADVEMQELLRQRDG